MINHLRTRVLNVWPLPVSRDLCDITPVRVYNACTTTISIAVCFNWFPLYVCIVHLTNTTQCSVSVVSVCSWYVGLGDTIYDLLGFPCWRPLLTHTDTGGGVPLSLRLFFKDGSGLARNTTVIALFTQHYVTTDIFFYNLPLYLWSEWFDFTKVSNTLLKLVVPYIQLNLLSSLLLVLNLNLLKFCWYR